MAIPSCNTFVVLPPLARNSCVVFGKNSDRPQGEVQELIYETPKQFSSGETLKCTYIEVDQVERTYGVILSKPAWMWGCEMGANDQGVVIGNGGVKTQVKCENKKGLLGTDLVRLALERCKTAEEGVDVITKLIAQYGQGGSYSETGDLFYYSSFLLADPKEAWILETIDVHWVAQKVNTGYRNISNCLSIGDQFDKQSPDVINFAKDNKFWNGEGQFNFAAAFGDNDGGSSKLREKYLKGSELLKENCDNNNFGLKNMFDILRNSEMYSGAGDFPTAASQVSLLSDTKPSCHWFTATPDPMQSVFKPFIFTPDVRISLHTKSPNHDSLASNETPLDRRHNLYKLHALACSSPNNKVITLLQDMEQNCLEEVQKFLEDFQKGQSLSEVDELLKDVVETEVKFYKYQDRGSLISIIVA